ncbi:head-tail adaptor protein [Epibacterium sp. Ofav1-8]|uniref:head-tail adaptor protein n=1 Tax=Epibacterium sp. Ofav1-8 TaxID=2917735 RepID=UPI001EF4E281|nr:head-tail adaptor protein [Epibacterium sp. Ofav1-8]MCG7623013.1 head-tail adaptor protein [Epibacterium sp. Ofav1-8]
MVLSAGSLNRRIQVQRVTKTPDGYGGFNSEWNDHGPAIFARRRDVSDVERLSAGAWNNKLVTRFIIRATAFGKGIRRTDRLVHEGFTYEISGIKEVPDTRAFLEITAETEETL